MQQKLMTMFYDEVRIDPSTLAFVEAHSTGKSSNTASNPIHRVTLFQFLQIFCDLVRYSRSLVLFP